MFERHQRLPHCAVISRALAVEQAGRSPKELRLEASGFRCVHNSMTLSWHATRFRPRDGTCGCGGWTIPSNSQRAALAYHESSLVSNYKLTRIPGLIDLHSSWLRPAEPQCYFVSQTVTPAASVQSGRAIEHEMISLPRLQAYS
ncbi:hypothetical protein MRB53_041286 [Persea americana]|nr:hypothetical protein MRB53_041286 [Persea americana]